jgi:predicted  nucleic acid-binding Zn-ribbon protein
MPNNTNKKVIVPVPTVNKDETIKMLTEKLKSTEAELNLANNKNAELTKIIEGMKGQTSAVTEQLKAERIKSNARLEYITDAIKHAYISVSMCTKGDL